MSKKRYFIARARLQSHLRRNWDDVESWLVYGDLLQERGDPRGELISIEEKLRDGAAEKMRKELEARRDALRRRLLGELADLSYLKCRWEWGAVRDAIVEPGYREGQRTMLATLETLLRRACACMLESLHLQLSWLPAPEALLRLLHRRTVTHLTLIGSEPVRVRQALTNAQRQLSGIRVLDLTHCQLGLKGARVLARGRHLGGLRALGLAANDLDAGALRELTSGFLTELRLLDISQNPVGDDGARALAQAHALRKLEVLDLRRTRISDKGVVALAGSGNLAALKELRLEEERLGQRGLDAILRSPFLSDAVKAAFAD
jgi:uncharacterized protein (TIGR02996 family)